MVPPLVTHLATYEIRDDRAGISGQERLSVSTVPGGFAVRSRLRLTAPDRVATEIDWLLDDALRSRVLHLRSSNPLGVVHDLEIAVTGNGILAHREAPDGPTQLELGWGPSADFDHLSAAFTEVMLARTTMAPGQTRAVSSLFISNEDLTLLPLEQEVSLLREAEGQRTYEVRVPATGHRARVSARPDGIVESCDGLWRLVSVDLGQAAAETK